MSALALNVTAHGHPTTTLSTPAKGSGSITEEKEERMEETQEFCKMLSSAQDMVVVLTHSQQELPARDQACQFFSRGRGEAEKSPLPTADGEGELLFSGHVATIPHSSG